MLWARQAQQLCLGFAVSGLHLGQSQVLSSRRSGSPEMQANRLRQSLPRSGFRPPIAGLNDRIMTGVRGQHIGPGEVTLAVVERYVHNLAPELWTFFVIDFPDQFVKRFEFDQFTRDTSLGVSGQAQSGVFAQVDQLARDASWDDRLNLPSCKQR